LPDKIMSLYIHIWGTMFDRLLRAMIMQFSITKDVTLPGHRTDLGNITTLNIAHSFHTDANIFQHNPREH